MATSCPWAETEMLGRVYRMVRCNPAVAALDQHHRLDTLSHESQAACPRGHADLRSLTIRHEGSIDWSRTRRAFARNGSRDALRGGDISPTTANSPAHSRDSSLPTVEAASVTQAAHAEVSAARR